jgi:hypothetical protein
VAKLFALLVGLFIDESKSSASLNRHPIAQAGHYHCASRMVGNLLVGADVRKPNKSVHLMLGPYLTATYKTKLFVLRN